MVSQRIRVAKPALWSLEHPALYTLVSSVLAGGREIDEVWTSVGIRSSEVPGLESGLWRIECAKC